MKSIQKKPIENNTIFVFLPRTGYLQQLGPLCMSDKVLQGLEVPKETTLATANLVQKSFLPSEIKHVVSVQLLTRPFL